MKTEFYRQIFDKYLNIKFHANPFSGSRVDAYVCTFRLADRRDEAETLVATFTNAPYKDLELLNIDSE